MKKFNKFLAIVLVLIMVITALPISAMADAWLDVDAEELPAGDGTKVTVTLDAKALAQLLVDEGVSKDTLKAILANATIDRDELLQILVKTYLND